MEVDLNESLEILNFPQKEKKEYKLILHNVTQTNFYQLKFPESVTDLILNGKMTNLIIPDGIKDIYCCNMGLRSIYICESLEFLECCDNELETIELTKNLLCANVRDNKITTVTCREKLEKLACLDILNNRVTDLNIDFPEETMVDAYFGGNENLKIKNIKFIFANNIHWNFISGDFLSVYGIEHYVYHEYLRFRLYLLASLGENYLDVKAVKDDEYFNNTLKRLCPNTWEKY